MTAQKRKSPTKKPKPAPAAKKRALPTWRRAVTWRRTGAGLFAGLFLFTALSYSLEVWYSQKHKHDPLIIGTTFVAPYARFYGLDAQNTLHAMINDVGFKHFRLVSYWDEIEKTPGTYDYSDLDWQFKMIEQSGGKVSLAIGLRQPRWPECHMPDWARNEPMTQWEPQVTQFIKTTMDRYKTSPALESYQLENEFFLSVFGDCPDFSRDRLIREYNVAKAQDPTHKIIIARSNNGLGYPVGDPRPDEFGVSVYKRVWDKTLTHRYFEYPMPAWFYGSLAGGGEILTGKKLIIHELQMEPWLPDNGQFMINDVSAIPEQNKSMNADILQKRFEYGKDTGIKTMYTWGSEWWYWRQIKGNDPSLMNVAKQAVQDAHAQNARNGISD